MQYLEEMDVREAVANHNRFMQRRAEGKRLYHVDGGCTSGKLFWLKPEEADRRRVEAASITEADVDYHTEEWECGTPWKSGSIEIVEDLLKNGAKVVLHNC